MTSNFKKDYSASKFLIIILFILLFATQSNFLVHSQSQNLLQSQKEKLQFEPVNLYNYARNKQPNTSEIELPFSEVNEHIKKVLSDTETSIYPQKLINESLTKSVNSKLPSLLVIFNSQEHKNRQAVSSFLKLWKNHKNKLNFILIDTKGQVNYYASFLLREYWEDEDLKVLALDSSGKIRIQMEDVRDLSRLDNDLTKLENIDPHGFDN